MSAGLILPAHVRQRCEAIVEQLLALLDACDPDHDLEDDGEAGAPYTLGDRPLFDDGSEDAEPSLSVPEPGLAGCHWKRAGQCDDDREGDLTDTENADIQAGEFASESRPLISQT